MTEHVQTPLAADADAPLAELKAQLEQPPKPKKSSGVAWLALLLVLLLAGAVAWAGYWLWPQWQQLSQQVAQANRSQQSAGQDLQQALATVTQQQQQALAAQQQQFSAWQQQQTALQQQASSQWQAQLEAIRQQVQLSEGAPPQHWLLMEVRYLLKRASQTLVLQQDINSARWLLQAADEQLARLDNAALLVVRQAIASDLGSLQQLTLPNISSLHLQLAQLRMQVSQLPLIQQQQQLLSLPQPDAELANWRQNLSAYWQQSWSKLFQVRPTQPADYYSLTEEQQTTVRLSLQQQFMLAEMALLQQEPDVYQAALRQAADLLQRYFAAEHSGVQQTSAAIVALASDSVSWPELPVLQSPQQLERQLSALLEAAYE